MVEEEWDAVIAVHLKGHFNCTKPSSIIFRQQRLGRIINFSSGSGIIGNAGQANYGAAKSRIAGFTRVVAKDLGRKKAKQAEGGDAEKSTVSERCLRYREPSECLSKERKPMRFCIDRYEYPNKKGELPALLISWVEAKKTCESLGKRLCTEEEFNFACEGEAMLPYTYGYVRDPSKCSIDKPYRKRSKKLYTYERCMKKPACKAELERLDQRLPAGSLPECVSPFGAYDMNGNINEWVSLPGKKYPDRSGLKGGWWGPVRGRCRPTVGFHKEEDYGYEEGFRCCGDAAPAASAPAKPSSP